MKKTYLQVLQQIEDLKTQAEKLRRAEIDGVVGRIREAISRYSLTAADLGLSGSGGMGSTGAGAAKAARKKPGPKPGSRRKMKGGGVAGKKVAPKYRDENGNTWAGRGKRPVWLRDAIAGGRRLEDFAIK